MQIISYSFVIIISEEIDAENPIVICLRTISIESNVFLFTL